MELESNLWESVFFFQTGSGIEIRLRSMINKRVHPLSHLSDPYSGLYVNHRCLLRSGEGTRCPGTGLAVVS